MSDLAQTSVRKYSGHGQSASRFHKAERFSEDVITPTIDPGLMFVWDGDFRIGSVRQTSDGWTPIGGAGGGYYPTPEAAGAALIKSHRTSGLMTNEELHEQLVKLFGEEEAHRLWGN
ncbi:MAG TPA: hypothetical protein VF914_21070 [Chloroflexia bacterium]|jgi:hypothetical protein